MNSSRGTFEVKNKLGTTGNVCRGLEAPEEAEGELRGVAGPS